ncbi:MAG TPA: YdcF family protein [Stellaceae bacterium]|nr:YdcF family protein [Stellaceae bacterium]
MSRPRLQRRYLLRAILLLLILWFAGLIWFGQEIPSGIGDSESETDAIVVLTGGTLRVERGLALLAEGKAKKLFISGVYHSTDVAALLHLSRQSPENVDRIELGREADNTEGNAAETARWMRMEGFHSLRLVTGSYHMPRSLLEFSRAMPDMRIIANPVFPENVKQERWWAWPGTAMLILAEYNKYLLALARAVVPWHAESGA